MKTTSLQTLIFVVVIVLLIANTIRLHYGLANLTEGQWLQRRKICLLQVQLMDRLLAQQEGQELDQLISNPEQWLAPLKETINRNAKLASLIRNVAFTSAESPVYIMCCNPVDENPEPFEEFTFGFEGNHCTGISRRALCPW